MDPDEALRLLGNPSEKEFYRRTWQGNQQEIAKGLAQWLHRGGFKPRLWEDLTPPPAPLPWSPPCTCSCTTVGVRPSLSSPGSLPLFTRRNDDHDDPVR